MEVTTVPSSEEAGVWETATARAWNSSRASIVDADIRDRDARDDAPLFLPSSCHNMMLMMSDAQLAGWLYKEYDL